MEPSIEIQELIRGWFEATANGDASWRDRYVSRHPSLKLVGTEPDDWLEGYSAYKFLKDEAARLGGDVTIDLEDVTGYEEGTVGWGVARPTVTLPDGRRITSRWSAVFHLNGTEWKIVQLHSSFGVPESSLGEPNREATGSTPA
jgi:ketosteroid isomerase-like protein